MFPTTVFRWVVNISEDREATASMGNLFQRLINLTVKHLHMFKHNFLVFYLCPFPPILSLDAAEKSLSLPSFHPSIRYLHRLIRSL